jgi:zinc transport system ATP-binding protein
MVQKKNLLVSVKAITYRVAKQVVLDNVSLEIARGEVVTLIGPNGSGKTTLAKILLGLQRPDQGEVFKQASLVIGYMPQIIQIDRVLPITVRRFLRIDAKNNRLTHRGRIEQVAKQCGIEAILLQQMHDISGGEMQRVLLARALLRNPDLMVLDEPTQGMDMQGQAEFYKLLQSIQKQQKCGILMISHDLHMVMASTSKVICINRHICCQGYPEEINQHPEYLALFGKKEAQAMAVYTHEHDHSHDVSGHICQHQGK